MARSKKLFIAEKIDWLAEYGVFEQALIPLPVGAVVIGHNCPRIWIIRYIIKLFPTRRINFGRVPGYFNSLIPDRPKCLIDFYLRWQFPLHKYKITTHKDIHNILTFCRMLECCECCYLKNDSSSSIFCIISAYNSISFSW